MHFLLLNAEMLSFCVKALTTVRYFYNAHITYEETNLQMKKFAFANKRWSQVVILCVFILKTHLNLD